MGSFGRYFITALTSTLVMSGVVSAEGSINLQVLSATIKDKTVPQAQVIIQKDGATSVSKVTGADGKVSIPETFGGDNNALTLIIKKEGYSSLIAKCPCNNLVYALSANMAELDGLRVVLSWNGEPGDLDLHTVYPNNHIYFSKKNGTDADLDVDDTDGYGPETITIRKKKHNDKYIFAVHNYSAGSTKGTTTLTSVSDAKIFVYIGQSLIKSYQAPSSGTGSLWVVFGVDENGAFHDINQMSDAGGSESAGSILKNIINQKDFGPGLVATAETMQKAKAFNKKGEDAYHAGNIEGSVNFYRQAIDLYSDFGQAYSNMGLSYMKLNQSAEAIWASRKAIELAVGETAPTVRASSYYNIAKMYEAKGEWDNAKQNYQTALQNKENQAYTKGIQRMNEKLSVTQ